MAPTTDDRDDDKAWLDALAGRPASVMDGRASRQVELLRQALDSRKGRLEAEVPVADEELFGRIEDDFLRARQGQSPHRGARRRQRDDESDGIYLLSIQPRALYRLRSSDLRPDLSGANSIRPKSHPWIWGLAAITLVALVTLQQWSPTGDNEHLILRGPADAVQIVDDPDARLAELTTLLKAEGATPEVQRDKNGTVRLTVTASDAVLDALATQRLQPQPQDGKVVLILQKPPADKKP